MQYKNPGRLLNSATLAALILGLVGGMALESLVTVGLMPWNDAPNIRLIYEASALVHRYYVDRPAERPPTLTYGAISGMVDALGDTGHSRFLSPAMVQEMAQIQRNKFQGIGAEVRSKDGHVVIVAPMDGSPAQRAGLKPGDIILQVNGHDVAGKPLEQVVKEISGPAGSSVTLAIFRPAAGQTHQVTITRAVFQLHNVTWRMLPGTHLAQLRIAAFETGASADLRKALVAIKKQPADGVVLDLRNNPGGLLGEAVDCASEFLKGGNVLLAKNARGQERPVPVKPGGVATAIPLVVLVNQGTASGAEIMAGALKDAHRGLLVGETTFGTGTLLTQFNLADGSALLLAVEEWLTPSGSVIWHKGITPNIVTALAAGVSPDFPEGESEMTAKQLEDSGDAQLLRGMTLLP
ncbi:MAG TPA: S41 family peptidase [Acidobacteriaceae bacterium]|nr:S41 family peptidase [Acidobacteriaceae bacterium]